MTEWYALTSSLFCYGGFAIWKKSDWFNTLIKLVFLALAVWGTLCWLILAGFIIAP